MRIKLVVGFNYQIPQPIQSLSEMKAILESEVTSIQSLPVLTTGQDFLHSCRHFFGLHLSLLTMAMLEVMISSETKPICKIHVPGKLVSRHLERCEGICWMNKFWNLY